MLSHVPSIGENIKAARDAAGITTQGELAKRLGVPQPQLSDWENDRYGAPDMKTLLKIAATIPCALDDLVRGLDERYDAMRREPTTPGSFSKGTLVPAPLSGALGAEMTALWTRLEAPDHVAILTVVRSILRIAPAEAEAPPSSTSTKTKGRRDAHRSR